MRIIQCPIEIAGQMGMLCKGLLALGQDVTAYNTFHSYLGYRDSIHNLDKTEMELFMLEAIQCFDLFHFHYSATMVPGFLDLPVLAHRGKRMVMHHWGNDVRTLHEARRTNPYVYTGDSPPADQVHKRLQILSKFIRHAIVQDNEVSPYITPYYDHVHVVPLAFDVAGAEPRYPSLDEAVPLLIHAPTNPLFKGTDPIETAIHELKRDGLQFRYQRVERRSNREALELIRKADLIVDQILCGSYGMLAVESMSLGKPVITFIRDDLRTSFPEVPPIMSANPDTIKVVLQELIMDAKLRRELGLQGRVYAERIHDLPVVGRRLMEVYAQVV